MGESTVIIQIFRRLKAMIGIGKTGEKTRANKIRPGRKSARDAIQQSHQFWAKIEPSNPVQKTKN